MAEQSGRQPFRFRIPWVVYSAPTALRQPTQAQPTQPPTTVRPPFRPPGVAPPRSSSQPQVSPSAGAQPPTPIRTASRPPSPAKTVPPRPPSPVKDESQPASPIKALAQPQVASQPASPIRKGPTQPQAPAKPASSPPSPSGTTLSRPGTPTRAVSQGQATVNAETQSSSPIQPATQPRVASQPSSPSPVKDKSQPASPIKALAQPQVASQPASPIRKGPTQPQAPAKPASSPPSPSGTTLSRPGTPTRAVSQGQATVNAETQSSSPIQPATQPRVASQPSSPIKSGSQPQTPAKSKFQPSSPSNTTPYQPQTPPRTVSSQLEAPTQKTTELPSPPLIHAPRSKLTTQAPMKIQSPPRSSALPSTKMATLQESSQLPRPYLQEAESFSEKNNQPDLKATQPSVSPAITSGPSQYPAQKSEPDEIKQEKTKSKQIEDVSKLMTVPELHRASTSSIQPKDQLGTSEEDKKQLKKQEHTRENEVSAKLAPGKERKRTLQNHSHANTEFHPPAIQGEASLLHKEIRDNVSKFAHKMSGDRPQQICDENPVSVTTIAGENTGATMHLGTESAKKESSIRIHRGYKLNQEDISEATTDGDNSARRLKDPKTKEDTAGNIYVNSNTQSVNNSIMMHSSISEGSPGVHATFTHSMNEPTKSNKSPESTEIRRADFNINPSQKLTYEPTVKRRCLRGLFLESSDSDPDNPNKPRRHGCRYDCKEKQKGKENGNDC